MGEPRPELIKLDPQQVKILDALAEAAHVPHQRGHAEIEIPDNLRYYNRYRFSPDGKLKGWEYKGRWYNADSEDTHARERRNTTASQNSPRPRRLAEEIAKLQEQIADLTKTVWELRGEKRTP
jgi:hypothetical protein